MFLQGLLLMLSSPMNRRVVQWFRALLTALLKEEEPKQNVDRKMRGKWMSVWAFPWTTPKTTMCFFPILLQLIFSGTIFMEIQKKLWKIKTFSSYFSYEKQFDLMFFCCCCCCWVFFFPCSISRYFSLPFVSCFMVKDEGSIVNCITNTPYTVLCIYMVSAWMGL